MDFEAWTNQATDPVRQKRLLAGYGVGATAVAVLGVFLSLTAAGVAQEMPEEEVLDVQLAEEPEPEPEPEPEVEPEPEPEPADPQPRPRGPVLPKLTTPTEIPDDAPEETDSKPEDNPYAAVDPYMLGAGSRGTAPRKQVVVQAPPPEPKPEPKARPAGPIRVTEGTSPPKPLNNPRPGYTASAKAAGVEGTVIVKYVVTMAGTTTQVKAVRGPEELRQVCEDMVKSWTFEPAIRDGQPVSVYRMSRFNFRLKT